MLKLKTTIKIIFLLTSLYHINNSYAASSCQTNWAYNIKHICSDSNCYSTENDAKSEATSANVYILDWYLNTNIKLKTVLNTKIANYKIAFNWVNFNVVWFCTNSSCTWSWWIIDKSMTFDDLIDTNTSFKTKIWSTTKTYVDWTNYFLRNYENVLKSLHLELFSSAPPAWVYNITNDISKNIIWVWIASNFLEFKNICDNWACSSTSIWNINRTDNSTHTILTNWNRIALDLSNYTKHNDELAYFSVNKTIVKAWWWVTVWFWFHDLLPESWCPLKTYRYRIYNKYVSDATWSLLFEQQFKVNTSNWAIIWDLDALWYVNSSKIWNLIKIEIKEPIIRTILWNETFNVEIIDEDENYQTDSIIQNTPLEVISWDPVEITASLTSDYDRNINYYINDTFTFKILLKDTYWNIVNDSDRGLDISYNENNSYNLATSSWVFQNWSISWIKNIFNDYYEFRFQPTSSLNYLKRFNINFYKKDDNWNSTNTAIPLTLMDNTDWGILFISSVWANNDFNIACTKNDIVLRSICERDNLSWCNDSANQTLSFSTNGWNWGLTISDYAFNQKSYSYNINHIDKVKPSISIAWYSIWQTHKIKADWSIVLDISDATAPACNTDDFITYKIYNRDDPSEIFYSWQTNAWDRDISLTLDILEKTWNKKLIIEATDKYGNMNTKEVTFIVVPWDLDQNKSSISLIWIDWSKFADNNDFYEYKLILRDAYSNPIYSKRVDLLNQDCWIIPWCKKITTNMVNNSWNSSLKEYNYSDLTSLGWEITFRLKSLAPWLFTERFFIEMNKWDNNYIDNLFTQNIFLRTNNTNSFKKPFKADLQVSDDDWASWNWNLSFWTALKYRLNISRLTSLNTYIINNFRPYIKVTNPANYSFSISGAIDNLNSSIPTFEATLNTSLSWTSINSDLGVKIDPNPIVSDVLWWENISYYLTKSETDYTTLNPLQIWNSNDFLWVKVIWNLQWQWKQEITWQEANFSDLSKQTIRTSIRKNAYKYISSMTSGTIVNRVKYVEWDISISWNLLNYETLIVKNWNVIITWNLNPNKNKLWIIVIKDWYNVENDYVNKWNVYVKPNVTEINALIYADWALISSDNSWSAYVANTTSRTFELNKQLILNWSLFTKNTIWWAILSWWDYKLPWWKSINNFDKAMIYDLNYIRRWKQSCLTVGPWICKYDDWAFIVIYNPSVQTNPPKLFTK